MTRLLIDLDNDDFKVRNRAREELKSLKEEAEPFLRRALKDKLSLEVRRRVEELLGKIEEAFQPGGVSLKLLQQLRAVEVFERIGTPSARQALRKVAESPPREEVGDDARASLQRLSRHLP